MGMPIYLWFLLEDLKESIESFIYTKSVEMKHVDKKYSVDYSMILKKLEVSLPGNNLYRFNWLEI